MNYLISKLLLILWIYQLTQILNFDKVLSFYTTAVKKTLIHPYIVLNKPILSILQNYMKKIK